MMECMKMSELTEPGPLRRSATKAELQRLANADGIPLGEARGLTLRAPRDMNVAVIAPAGSGTTQGIVLPAVVSWEGPVVVASPKLDIFGHSSTNALGWRQTVGHCWVFDPSGRSGLPCLRWSPLPRAATWPGALATARAMASAVDRRQGEYGMARATDALAPLLHAAAVAGLTMGAVLSWARTGDIEEPRVLLEEYGATQDAISAIESLKAESDPYLLSDTLATLTTLLSPWQDYQVVERTMGGVWTTADLLAGDNSLFILGDDCFRPMIAALLDEVMAELAAATVKAGGRLPRPVLVALDEVADVGVGNRLPSWIAKARACSTQFLTSWKAINEMHRVCGRTGPQEILADSPIQLWWWSPDWESMRELVGRCGYAAVRQVSEILTSDAKRPTRTVSTTQLDALDLSALHAQSDPVLLAMDIPPVMVTPPWAYRERSIRQRAVIPPNRERLASEAEAAALAAEGARLPPDN